MDALALAKLKQQWSFTNKYYFTLSIFLLDNMKLYVILVLLLLNAKVSLAQQKEYTFINYSSRNGLSSNTVNAIVKDKYGFIWFGTEDGLNRFDGQNFKLYRHRDNDSTSLQRGHIKAICLNKNGQMWVATTSSISLYDPNTDGFINFDFNKYGWILTISTDHSGKVWVGTFNGLFVFDPKTKTVKPLNYILNTGQSLLSGHIYSLFEDSKRNLWIGSTNGLFYYHQNSGNFTQYTTNSSGISSNEIHCISEDKQGAIWIGTTAGLNRFKDGKFVQYRSTHGDASTLSGNTVNTLAFNKKEELWVGTNSGVDILDLKTDKIKRLQNVSENPNALQTSGRSVRKIFIDNDDIYWVATHQGGINKYDPNLPYFSHATLKPLYPYGPTASSVVSIAEDAANKIFIGTEGGGLKYFDRQTNKVHLYRLAEPKLNSASFIALLPAGNTLWAATYQFGLYQIRGSSVKHVKVPRSKTEPQDVPVNCINVDKHHNVWLGTIGGGIRFFNTNKEQLSFADEIPGFENNPLNSYITDIEEDQKGNIWIASYGTGIAMYNPINHSFLHLNKETSGLPSDHVHNLLIDKKNRVWAGTTDGGLCLFDPKTKKFKTYNENYYLANGVVYKILEDNKGTIWISTNKGISSFDPEKEIFRNFSLYNGVQQSTFNGNSGLKTKDGELFFGGLDGFNHFFPSEISPQKSTPPLVITSLRVNNREVKPGGKSEISQPIAETDRIDLNYKQNFALDFIALNLSAPHENRYVYKLDGFDKEWNFVGENNTANYTNLDPGKYVFRLKAQSEDGSWITPEKVITIIVHPPFWKTFYAYLFYSLLFFGTLWAIRRRSIQRIKNQFVKEQEKLEMEYKIEKERQKVQQKIEIERVKVKFLTNLSHELKTPLTLVVNPIENLMFQEQNAEKLEMLNLISRNAKRLLNLVNQLLDFKKIETNELTLTDTEGDLVEFAREISEAFKYIAVRKNINFKFSSEYNNYITRFDKDKIERILLNLISNAIKFTPEAGSITFMLKAASPSGINFIIRDTGIGFPEELKNKIFERFYQVSQPSTPLNQGSGIGLSIAQEFVALHKGTIKVDTEENVGSTFTVWLPLEPISYHEIDDVEHDKLGQITGFALQKPPAFELPTVLVLDDDDDLRTYLVESLKSKYKVIEAKDGKQGWQKALTSHPQVIVSDVDMPFMNGIELLQKLKSDKRTKHIPVILLTVLSDHANQMTGLEAGASDYLSKPFSFNLLSIKIENLLSLSNELKSTYKKQISVEKVDPQIIHGDEKFLYNMNKYIEEHLEDTDLSIENLSKAMFVSRGTLYNKVLALTGETPVEYIRSQKLAKAMTLLEKSDLKISEIAYSVGFSNPNYFARAFRAKYNISPTEFLALVKKKTV